MTLYLYPCHPSVAWCDKFWAMLKKTSRLLIGIGAGEKSCWLCVVPKHFRMSIWMTNLPKICSEIIKQLMINQSILNIGAPWPPAYIFVVWLSCINSWLGRWLDTAQPFNVQKNIPSAAEYLQTCRFAAYTICEYFFVAFFLCHSQGSGWNLGVVAPSKDLWQHSEVWCCILSKMWPSLKKVKVKKSTTHAI